MDKKVFPGARFGKLEVLSEGTPIPRPDKPGWKRRTIICKCDCGNQLVITRDSLTSGKIKSCGCINKQKGRAPRRITHGKTKTRLYRIWSHMKARCDQPNNNRYYRYGARGIKVCDEWHCSFEAFYEWAINNGYQDSLTIERKNNALGYSPENCCWIPLSEQGKNKGDGFDESET